ncbi:T9SS type A sorting domain-containing protein [Hymenobacter sp. BRD67]|uniref:T9SS type A sorting domain-containing protein n=1 Tax=Hymenobacter sp. BRD67 TaxID=2675877 RepID=UPI0015635733|nr:T9SS type A sorting domain-containing protein [Hymenobacter sp. BRD67]QKG54354.1 T9SS type A sorting domain-containing protein [Hymenobacter sp. BRD67]
MSNTTLADLTTAGYTPEISQASVYNSSATPGTTTPFPTLFSYDQSRLASVTNNYSAFDKGFVVPTSLSAPMSVGKGYVAQIGAAQLVDFVGTPTTGDQSPLALSRNATGSANATDAGWQLVGNPYPAPLDYSLVAPADRSGLDAAMYVVQSTGPYAGGYRTYVNGQSTSTTNNPLIGSSQGFWVRVSTGQTTGSLTFRNAQRVTSYASQAAFQRTAADTRPALRLELAGAGLADAWVAYVEAGATPSFDSQYDAAKLANSTGLNLSSTTTSGERLAIDGRPAFTSGLVLPLAVGVPAAGSYTLTAAAFSNLPAGLDAYLTDSQNGQTLKLSVGTSYNFAVSATQATSLLTGRFSLRFGPQTALATLPELTATSVAVYPNPAHGRFSVEVPGIAQAASVQVELLNTLGQVVGRQTAALPAAGTTLTVETTGLAAGVYTLRLQAGTSTLAKRVVIQ